MSCKLFIASCVLALVQSITAQFIGPFGGLAASEYFGGSYGPFAAPFAEAAWASPYGMGPFAETAWAGPYGIAPCVEAAWATPYGMSPFAEAAWATPYGFGPFADAAWGPYGFGLGPAALSASNGAGLMVTSASPVAPTGVSIVSENAYEGPLAIAGAIPFLGAVTLEGALPTFGGGAVSYGCGNGAVGIVSEDLTPCAYDGLPGPAFAFDGFVGPFGYDGIVGPGCGRIGPYGYGGMYY